ncbi:MAG: CRISPR-associated endonuclease Cas1 [Acidobacteria bacterium]|nr:CRISPR-associated endonuclease Cas1 [Acidobacteriota bacterium]
MEQLHAKLFSPNALRRAWRRVEESDGCAGIDGVSIPRFAARIDVEIARLSNDLIGGAYLPLPLLRFAIPKKSGGERVLNVAAVRDRIAQHAVIAHVEPLFEAEFENCSYGYRRGRSVKQALAQIKFLRDSGYTWVVEADIESYFDSVDHALLLKTVTELIADEKILNLISSWIAARIYDGKKLFTVDRGLPQGQPVSPYLANLFLDSFDEEISAGGRKLVRFADDFLILCKSKPKAQSALKLTRQILAGLKLSVNEGKTRVTNFAEGFRYLGATFTHSFCLVPTPGSAEKNDVDMPFRLFSSEAYKTMPGGFNPAISREIKEALGLMEEEMTIESVKDASAHATEPNEFAPPALYTLCTLYVHEHGAVISCENSRIRIEKDDAELLSLPIAKLDQIILYGNSQVTTAAIKSCLKERIPISFFAGQGRFLGSIEARSPENVELRKLQFERSADESFVTDTARRIVAGKIASGRALLMRRQRENKSPSLDEALQSMATAADSLAEAADNEQIFGCEGAAGAAYFRGFSCCIDPPFEFKTRSRRPPLDPVNSLLSFGYSMLFQNIYALVRGRGLSTDIGNLHAVSYGHPALCSDLIEEFRAPVVDALVTRVINSKMFSTDDFAFEDWNHDEDEEADGAAAAADQAPMQFCRLSDDARRKFVRQFESRMNTVTAHKGAGIKTTWRGCIDLQIGHYIKVLRGEIPAYRPMEFR